LTSHILYTKTMIGNKVRELREEKNILLRQLAPHLEMDTAILSKMERGDRSFRKKDIIHISKLFDQPEEELLILWLADKVLKNIAKEKYQKEALTLAINAINNKDK